MAVQEAAGMLGTSVDAVRKRIRRGTLRSEREDGRVYVWVDGDPDAHAPPYREAPHDVQDESRPAVEAKEAHIAALEGRIGSLEKQLDVRAEELRRKDHIIAGLVERVPALEPPSEAREAPQPAPETTGGEEDREGEGGPENGSQRRSWWRRLFLGE
jgi:hypothetical protein